jgi:hypothetical protein
VINEDHITKSNIMKITWHTGKPENATHVIDDGGMIYWSVTPEMTNDQVAAAFASDYDGTLGKYDVTDLRTEERSDYEA